MGSIKLYNDDCIKILKDIETGGVKVDFVLTDIPYDAVNRKSNGLRTLDKEKADELHFDLKDFLDSVYNITKNSLCIFCGKEQFSTIYECFSKKKGTVRPIVWQKSNPSPMNGQYIYLSGVELAVWFKKSGAKVFNAHCKNTVFKYPNGSSKLHPTSKNLDLFTELLLDNTNEGNTVLDPCMGSGTSGVACINTNRNFIGIEIDEKYFNIAKDRITESIKALDNNK